MDTKNVIAAISLSAAVIILYSLFFAPEPVKRKENLSEKDKIEKMKLAGITISDSPADIGKTLYRKLNG